MKLRNLLHLKEDETHLIGSITPPFFFRVSEIMEEFLRLCDKTSIEEALTVLKEQNSPEEFESFQQRLEKIKDKLFVDEEKEKANQIDLSAKVTTLALNVTRKCNLKCDYCFEDAEWRKFGEMPFSIAQKAIDTFFTDNSSQWVIIFTGGEPMLNFDLITKVVNYIEQRGVKVEYRIKTNGTLIDDEKIDFLIKNNFKIQISLDGNEKAHDTHRKFANGKGTFEIVDGLLRKLIEKEYGSKISISGTLTHQTIQYVDDCYAHMNSYSEIKGCTLKSVMTNSHSKYAFTSDDYMFANVSNLNNNKYLMQQGIKLVEDKKINTVCGIGVWNITIDIDGMIYPCYRLCGNEKYVIGNLQLLKLPLKLPKELENLYMLDNNIQCINCYFINVCKMGCYTDKLMFDYRISHCFNSKKLIVEEIFCNVFLKKRMYLLLDIV